jgi:hypothetical protein
MAYYLTYTADFTNEQGQLIEINIYQLDPDVIPTTTYSYKVTKCQVSTISDEQDSYATILSKELQLSLWTESTDAITWETFITSAYNEWKVEVISNGYTWFVGFITPDEGSAPFQDKPYEINITATDGIGLLKGYQLVDVNGDRFENFNLLIDYIAGALRKTELELPIRAYCGYFWNSMQDKGDALTYDLFNQAEIHARTLLKNPGEYESCYDTLKVILQGWAHVIQHNGKWQIVTLAERQYLPGSWYYVDYTVSGVVSTGNTATITGSNVGKAQSIYPINESQNISSLFANRQVVNQFDYSVPTDLVNNQALQYLGAFNGGVNGYDLVGWTHYKGSPTSQSTSSVYAYIKQLVDGFGNMTDRYYVVPIDTTATGTNQANYIRNNNNDFFVDNGDKINISVTFKMKYDETSGSTYNITAPIRSAFLLILKDGASGSSNSDWYCLDSNGNWQNNPNGAFANFIYPEATNEWKTVSVDSNAVRESGTAFLLISRGNNSSVSGNEMYLKDIKIDLQLNNRGSIFNLAGDKHTNAQSSNLPDTYSNTVRISDSPKKIIKGSLFCTISSVRYLITTSFFRYPNTEILNWKQLINYGKYNQSYRRFWKIEGDFTNGTNAPLDLAKRYLFSDISPTRTFILVPSVEEDLMTGNFRAVFQEVIKTGGSDGTQTGTTDEFSYIFK